MFLILYCSMRGPRSRNFSGSHFCHRCGGSTTWSSTLMILGSSIAPPPLRPARPPYSATPWALRPAGLDGSVEYRARMPPRSAKAVAPSAAGFALAPALRSPAPAIGQRAQRTIDRILGATRVVFLSHGYGGTTIDD